MTSAPLRRSAPLLLFVAVTAGLLALLPERPYGDDVYLVHRIVGGEPFTRHALYMPVARAAAWLGAQAGLDPFRSLRVLSVLGTAAGAAFLFAAATRRGRSLGIGLALALLVLGAPSALFFGTAAEIHGLHLGAVGLLAWTLARLGPRSGAGDVLLAALAFGIGVVGTHQSGVLLLPGTVALYALATRGRERAERGRDLAWAAGAMLLTLAVRAGLTWLETGALTSDQDEPGRYWRGLVARLEGGWGPGDFLAYLSNDLVTPAFVLCAGGLAGLGALARRDRPAAAALALVLLPYVLFFPVWGYPEQGAFYVPVLPALAAALVLWSAEPSARGPAPLATGLLALAGLGALLSPPELREHLGALVPALLALGFLVAGAVVGGSPLATRHAPAVLLLLAVLQLAGAARALRAWDRADTLLAWARGACEETAGEEAIVISAGFERLWLLRLLHEPWPEPYAGTWPLAEGVPLPGPYSHTYADPALPLDAFAASLRDKLARGVPVYVDASVRALLAGDPRHGAFLELIEATYRLERVRSGAFRAERVLP